jgi:methyl-accepting chemotaxis protein
LELRMSTARADAAIARATWLLALVGGVALVVVCGLLLWILKSATRPIEALTETMAKLSSGDLTSRSRRLDRADEVGRMAHAVEVFKRNAIEVERLNAEQAAMKRGPSASGSSSWTGWRLSSSDRLGRAGQCDAILRRMGERARPWPAR